MKKTNQTQDKELVSEIKKDYLRRKEERKPFEAQWQLNINFLMGNQYCGINSQDNIDDFDKQYFWQEREVYNHIAPLIDIRLAKLAKVRTQMAVQPSSTQEDDVANAKLCKNILESVSNRLGFGNIVAEVTRWSEICGTGFYKIVWNDKKGAVLGIDEHSKAIKQGDIDVVACSPFEVFPDSNTNKDVPLILLTAAIFAPIQSLTPLIDKNSLLSLSSSLLKSPGTLSLANIRGAFEP